METQARSAGSVTQEPSSPRRASGFGAGAGCPETGV